MVATKTNACLCLFADYSELFMVLKTVRGNLGVRTAMAKKAASEARRFKRRGLAELIEEFVFDESV